MTNGCASVLRYLNERKKGASVEEICAALHMTRSVVSKHIKELFALNKVVSCEHSRYRRRIGAPLGNTNRKDGAAKAAKAGAVSSVAAASPAPAPEPPTKAPGVLPPSTFIRQLTPRELMRGRA